MKCPVTGEHMIVVERNRIEIDYCSNCGGIWFDSGELELLSEALGVSISLPDYLAFEPVKSSERVRNSPRTGKSMDKINLGTADRPIIIDRDKDGLGLWFDAGEMASVIELYLDRQSEEGNDQVLRFLGETIHH